MRTTYTLTARNRETDETRDITVIAPSPAHVRALFHSDARNTAFRVVSIKATS